jgi:IclR family acetate operon transcriptional repressor
VLPLEGSSATAAIAAHLPEAELRPIQQAHPSLDDRRLGAIRRRGWADTDGEAGMGSRAVAAALLGTDGYPIGALAVSGPVSRVGTADLPRLGALVAQAAQQALADS